MNRHALSSLCLFFLIAGCDNGSREEMYARGIAEIKNANPTGAQIFFKSALERDPDFYDARYELAKAYRATGRNELAEKEFLRLLQQRPEQDTVRIDLARIYIAARKPAAAAEIAEQYSKSHGHSAETDELLGIAALQNRQPELAEKYLRQVLSAEPGRTSAKLELATLYVVYRIAGKEAETRRLLAEVIQADPRSTAAYYVLADLEYLNNRPDLALAHYQTISRLDPNDFNAPYRLGLAAARAGQLDLAGKYADELRRKFPKRSEGPRLAGIIAYYRNDYATAISDLLSSTRLFPSDEAAYYLALSYYSKGDLESSLSQLYKLHNDSQYSEPAQLLTAIVLLRQKRTDDAISTARKILAERPKSGLAHNILGSAYMLRGQFDSGINEFNRALELDPQIVDAHLKKGAFHLSSGRLVDAERDFSSAVQAAPQLLNSRLILSCFYLRENQPEKARAILQQGLGSGKSDAVLLDQLAALAFASGDKDAGIRYLQRARTADPDYAAAGFHLATCYITAGDGAKARQEYQRIVESHPDSLAAWLSLAALQEYSGEEEQALKSYQQALATGDEKAYLALADFQNRKGNREAVISLLDDGIRTLPESRNLRLYKISLLTRQKDYKNALRTADELEGVDAEAALQRRIEIYRQMNDHPKAFNEAERFITLHPGSAFGHRMLALLYEQVGQVPLAVAALDRGSRAEPQNAAVQIQLGELYVRQKDFTAARRAFAEARRIDPETATALFAEGALSEALGDRPGAIKKYLEALEKDGDYVPALNNLAYLYLAGDSSVQEGLRLAFQGYRKEPGNPQLLDTLGLALLKNRRSNDARKVLEKAAHLLPEAPAVAYHLALAYNETGSPAKALPILERITRQKNYPEYQDAQKLLASLQQKGGSR